MTNKHFVKIYDFSQISIIPPTDTAHRFWKSAADVNILGCCQQPTTSSQHKVEYQVTLLDNREKRGGGGRNQDGPAGIADQLYYVGRGGDCIGFKL